MRRTIKNTFKRIPKIMLIAIMVLSMVPLNVSDAPIYAAVTEDDIREEEEKLEEIQSRIDELTSYVDELSGNITSLQGYISEVDAILADLSIDIYNLNMQIAQKEIDIANKQTEIDNIKLEIEGVETDISNARTFLAVAQESEIMQYESMKLRIQYMYENGDNTFIDILFSSESMIDFLNNAEYIAEISEYDRDKLIEYAETKEAIATLLANLEGLETELLVAKTLLEQEEALLQTDKASLENSRAQLEAEEAAYDTILAAKSSELASAEGDKAYTEQQIALAEQQYADQEEIINQVKEEYAAWLAELAAQNQSAEAAIAAKLAEIGVTGFTWPVPGYNTITSEFGGRIHPILGIYKLHDGMDISGYNINNKPIVAAYGGTVVLSQSYYGYGNCVKIDHGGGIQTLYAHASALLVSVGQTVNAGDTIALVGSTGNSTGPHLHFSLIIGGEFVNPRDYVKIPIY